MLQNCCFELCDSVRTTLDIINRPIAHSRFDFKITMYTVFMTVLSLTSGKTIPGLARAMYKTFEPHDSSIEKDYNIKILNRLLWKYAIFIA